MAEPESLSAGDRAAGAAAVALWVVVGVGLAYGVWQTLLRAAQLFGG